MKRTILLLTALASLTIALHADEEQDLERAAARWEGHLNSAWSQLTPAQRNMLRADERRWIVWKDSLPLAARLEALGKRVDYLHSFLNK
jgi:lysozyme inhibitor LprI